MAGANDVVFMNDWGIQILAPTTSVVHAAA